VRTAVESGRTLSELTPDELASSSDLLGDDYYAALSDGAWLDSKISAGGTAAARLDEQLETAEAVVASLRSVDGRALSASSSSNARSMTSLGTWWAVRCSTRALAG
jgi:hypothetical protein